MKTVLKIQELISGRIKRYGKLFSSHRIKIINKIILLIRIE